MQGGEPLITGAGAIVALGLEMAKEPEHALEAQVRKGEPGDPAPGVGGNKGEKQPQHVAIAL